MTDYRDQDRNKVSPATTALGGLLVGLAVGIVATAMTNRQTRKRVLRQVDEMGQMMEDTYDKALSGVNNTWEHEISPRLQTANDAIRRTQKNTANKVNQEASELAVKGGEVADEVESKASSTRGHH